MCNIPSDVPAVIIPAYLGCNPLKQEDATTPTGSEDKRHPVKRSTRCVAETGIISRKALSEARGLDYSSTGYAKAYPANGEWHIKLRLGLGDKSRDRTARRFSNQGLESLAGEPRGGMEALIGVSSWRIDPLRLINLWSMACSSAASSYTPVLMHYYYPNLMGDRELTKSRWSPRCNKSFFQKAHGCTLPYPRGKKRTSDYSGLTTCILMFKCTRILHNKSVQCRKLKACFPTKRRTAERSRSHAISLVPR
jgi:hypothetical protein